MDRALSLEWLQDLETRAKASLGKFVAPQSETDRMIHELRVHRVELEMQNEELVRSQLELGQVIDSYRDLLAAAPLGYLAVDDAGRICETNPLAARLLGGEQSALHGNHMQALLSADDADRFHLGLRDCLQNGTVQHLDVEIAGRAGPAAHLRLQLSPVTGEALDDRKCWLFISELAKQMEAPSAEAGPGTATRVLLVVDDDLALLFAVERMLSLEEDYQVIAVSSGEEALEIARSGQRLDLLLTDVRMPGMNGGELGRRMASLRPDLPRLYMSGDLGDVILEEEATCIPKPFEPCMLLTTVTEHLSR